MAVGSWNGQAWADGRLSFGSVLGASLALLAPAVAFLGLGVADFGTTPRLAAAAVPGMVGLAFVVQLVGVLVRAPSWLLDLSSFHHLSAAPAASLNVAPMLVLVGVGILGVLLGATGFGRRDLVGG